MDPFDNLKMRQFDDLKMRQFDNLKMRQFDDLKMRTNYSSSLPNRDRTSKFALGQDAVDFYKQKVYLL